MAAALLAGEARADDPSPSASALLALARQAETEHRDDRAAALYRQAHRADPFDESPLNALGRLAARVGAAAEAVEYFEAALAIDRRDRGARHGLADAFLDLDRADDALAVYESLLAEDAGDGQAWNGKGRALEFAGRHDDARAAFEAALALLPDDDGISANLDQSQPLAAAPAELPAARDSAPADGVALALNAPDLAAAAVPVAPSRSAGRDP